MKIKDVLAYTNPVAIIIGVPFFIGVIAGCTLRRAKKDCEWAVKRLSEEKIIE